MQFILLWFIVNSYVLVDHRLELLCKQADEARKMEEVFRLRCQQAAKEETQSTQEVQKLQAKLTRRQEKCADLERQKLAALELFEDSVKQETDRLFEMFTKFVSSEISIIS